MNILLLDLNIIKQLVIKNIETINVPGFRFVEFHEEQQPRSQNDEERRLVSHIVSMEIYGSATYASAPNLHDEPTRMIHLIQSNCQIKIYANLEFVKKFSKTRSLLGFHLSI